MTQPDRSGRRSPRRRSTPRTDSTHPTPPRPGGRRGGDRRPWPTAPTTTRLSPGKPARETRTRSRGSASTPTPATVWTAGPAPIDPDIAWPPALLEKIVTSFSEPGARVVLLTWPTPNDDRPTLAAVGADGVVDHAPGAELDDALHAVQRLGRIARVERVPVDSEATRCASRPFWADLIGDASPAPATVAPTPLGTVDLSPSTDPQAASQSADLIITRLRPEHSGDRSTDLVALFAARLLPVGGILAVLTHCDWTTGELTDPTGAVVTAGQNADLLYLQHIVALHAPVRDGRFHLTDEPPDRTDDSAQARARHRAETHGLPAPHRRIHSDVLAFAQPHDHQPPTPAPPNSTAEKDRDHR
ncbi:hypothetical protein FKR81_37270 [Lentzea tibetensis]|uniref:Uncharacterized protein n=1 Tax=Lentzea tibetensis TaxID=2591470 RepID=A0A563EI83_9PSEU|nr:hypothetical protein [Lentzea tibetensis]TWP46030.1 hypothetical protein FKR81_37270 [Lentzea tibetensis]